MKPAPNVPGGNPTERLSNAFSMVLRVSNAALLKKEAQLMPTGEKKQPRTNALPDSAQPATAA